MEYASFHYLMHKVADPVKPYIVTGPQPLSFNELYSPRDGIVLLARGEKSFWRTRDRVEFCIYMSYSHQTGIITCQNVDTKAAYRTIFVSLEILFYEVEAKARGDREVLTKKKDKKLDNDIALYKSVGDFLLARLNIGADPLPWPKFDTNGLLVESQEPSIGPIVTTLPPIAADRAEGMAQKAVDVADASRDLGVIAPSERMCTLSKLTGDVYTVLEIQKPATLDVSTLNAVRLEEAPLTVAADSAGQECSMDTMSPPSDAASSEIKADTAVSTISLPSISKPRASVATTGTPAKPVTTKPSAASSRGASSKSAKIAKKV
jgi:hypothetical protein